MPYLRDILGNPAPAGSGARSLKALTGTVLKVLRALRASEPAFLSVEQVLRVPVVASSRGAAVGIRGGKQGSRTPSRNARA